MADDYEREEFEHLSEHGSQKNQDDDYNEDISGDSHKMRFSIDLHSIKDPTFRGLIYAKHGALSSLGIKPFSTLPPKEIVKTNVEEMLNNSFMSYEFTCSKQQLYPTLSEAKLEIEIYHQDRFKKDILIGIANVDISKVLRAPERQTPQSFVRTYDAYIPVDEVDESRFPVKRVALLRVIVYLEDMGPLDYLRQHEREVKAKYKDELDEIATIPAAINLNMPGSNVNDTEKVNFLNELGNIEYKIIWELENWKKAEEAKFRYNLKAKEVDYLKKLNEEWKKKELEREKIFKKSEVQVQQVENKLNKKLNELKKREDKLILLEEELKQKINETSRQLSAKDEEINIVKKKHREDKAVYEKDKAISSAKNEELQSKFSRLQEEYMGFRREQETSPINLIKNELSAKDLEISELKREAEKANEIKEQYRIYYERLKNEIIRLKKENESIKENNQRQNNAEIEMLKTKLNTLTLLGNKENFQSFRNEFQDLRNQFEEGNLQKSAQNPFKKNYLDSSGGATGGKNLSLNAARTRSAQERINKTTGNQGARANGSTEYDKLMAEKEDLMNAGYDEDDAVMINLSERISNLIG